MGAIGVKENLSVIDTFFETHNAQYWDRFMDLHADSVVQYGPDAPEPLSGRAAGRASHELYDQPFPDIHLTKERSFGWGD